MSEDTKYIEMRIAALEAEVAQLRLLLQLRNSAAKDAAQAEGLPEEEAFLKAIKARQQSQKPAPRRHPRLPWLKTKRPSS